MPEIRITIESETIPATVTAARWDGIRKFSPQEDQVFFRVKVNDLTFTGADYCTIIEVGECEEIGVLIEERCPLGDWAAIYAGTFTLFDAEVDRDRSEITVTPKTADLYKCVLDWWNNEVNVYDSGAEIAARGVIGRYEAGLYPCYVCRATPYGPPCNTQTDACEEYRIVASYPSPKCPEPNRFEIQTSWHREVGTGTPSSPPTYGTGWSYISGNDWWRCPDNDALSIGVHLYGRDFNELLLYVIGLATCENPITVRSHFFGINATHLSPPPGDAYDFAGEYLQKITLHQKSDVKRPDGNKSFSKVWTLKPKDLLDDLRRMFNVYWIMQGTPEEPELVLEHLSYFVAGVGYDYSSKKIRSKYKQDDTGIPKKEVFKWSDDVELANIHQGYPIEYECGDGERTTKVAIFTNDVRAVNESVNAENIADKNYVLMSTFEANGQRLIYPENEPLGWVQLHTKLHKYGRFFATGEMNNTAAIFTNPRKNKRLQPFTVPFCCGVDYVPEVLVNTRLGEAAVQNAEQNHFRQTLKLEVNI